MRLVNVNNNSIPIYDFDSVDTVKYRIAANADVTPDLINWKNFKKLTQLPKNKNVTFKTLYQELDNVNNVSLIPPNELYQTYIKPKFSISPKNFALEWFDYILKQQIPKDNFEILRKQLIPLRPAAFNLIENDFQTYDVEKQMIVEKTKQENDDIHRINDIIESQNPVTTQKFVTDGLIESYIFESDLSLIEIFNHLQPTIHLPFIHYREDQRDLIRVNKNIAPLSSWIYQNESQDGILFKVLNVDQPSLEKTYNRTKNIVNPEQYSTGFLSQLDDNKFEILLNISVTQDYDKNFSHTLIDKFRSSLQYDNFNKLSQEIKKVRGFFNIPNAIIYKGVFADMTEFDPIFNFLFKIDERQKPAIGKKKLYTFFQPGIQGSQPMTLILTPDIDENKQRILRVRIKNASDIGTVKQLQNIFSHLISYYNTKKSSIINSYRDWFPDFEKDEKQRNQISTVKQQVVRVNESKKSRQLRMKKPDIFPVGYSRFCQVKPGQPSIIDADQVEEWEDKGYQVLEYPGSLKPDEESSYYVCDNPDEGGIYPQLKENTLSNKDEYPYIPCCLKKNQQTKNQRILEGEKIPKTANKRILTTPKVLTPGGFGVVPDNINAIFQPYIDAKQKLLRYGIPRDNNSFINAVVVALNIDRFIQGTYKWTSLQRQSSKLRKKILDNLKQHIGLCKQSLYDYEINEIIELVQNNKNPFDSKVFINLLEDWFDIQIMMFERKSVSPQDPGSIEIPRYQNCYLREPYDPTKKSIIIIKHRGTTNQHISNPHYECIILAKYTGDNFHSLVSSTFTDMWVQTFATLYQKSAQVYQLTPNQLKRILFRSPPELDYSKHYLDSSGKVRMIQYKGINIFTEPMPALSEKEPIERLDNLKKTSYQKFQRFVNKYNIEIIGIDLNLNCILVRIGNNTHGVIYIFDEILETQYPRLNLERFKYETGSSDSDFVSINAKIAGILKQYVLWSYSTVYNQNEINIEEFGENYVEVIQNYHYDHLRIGRTLSYNSIFFDEQKLIVPSQKSKEYLLQYLEIQLSTNRDLVFKYYTRRYLKDYLITSADFMVYPNALLFMNSLSVSQWLDNLYQQYEVYYYLLPFHKYRKSPYFYHFDFGVRMIQNTRDLPTALTVYNIWNQHQINMGYSIRQQTPPNNAYRRVYFDDNNQLQLELLNNATENDPLILDYGNGYYAAVLEIL